MLEQKKKGLQVSSRVESLQSWVGPGVAAQLQAFA